MSPYSIDEIIADDRFRAWYLQSDAQKAGQWEDWLLQHPGALPVVEESMALMKELHVREQEVPAVQTEAALQQLQDALEAAPVVDLSGRRRRWWIPAAAVLMLLSIGLLYWSTRGAVDPLPTLASRYGAISHFRLPDGSEVTLNANSRVTLSDRWVTDKSREVWLTGEAFFSVQKTPAHTPFIVHTQQMDVVVTGTQFNVVSREEESSVLLTEGRVTIQTRNGRQLHLQPGDYVALNNSGPALQPVDQQKVLAWKQSKLSFENTPMQEVARIIERHYGVRVTITDSATREKTVSGIMPNDNLEVLIQALGATGTFRITKTGDEIIISGS